MPRIVARQVCRTWQSVWLDTALSRRILHPVGVPVPCPLVSLMVYLSNTCLAYVEEGNGSLKLTDDNGTQLVAPDWMQALHHIQSLLVHTNTLFVCDAEHVHICPVHDLQAVRMRLVTMCRGLTIQCARGDTLFGSLNRTHLNFAATVAWLVAVDATNMTEKFRFANRLRFPARQPVGASLFYGSPFGDMTTHQSQIFVCHHDMNLRIFSSLTGEFLRVLQVSNMCAPRFVRAFQNRLYIVDHLHPAVGDFGFDNFVRAPQFMREYKMHGHRIVVLSLDFNEQEESGEGLDVVQVYELPLEKKFIRSVALGEHHIAICNAGLMSEAGTLMRFGGI